MNQDPESRPPFPPFDATSAAKKARMAEDGWNRKDPIKISQAYSADSRWRNRSLFLEGRDGSPSGSSMNGMMHRDSGIVLMGMRIGSLIPVD